MLQIANCRDYVRVRACMWCVQLTAHETRSCGGAAALEKGKGKAGITAGPFFSELQAEVSCSYLFLEDLCRPLWSTCAPTQFRLNPN